MFRLIAIAAIANLGSHPAPMPADAVLAPSPMDSLSETQPGDPGLPTPQHLVQATQIEIVPITPTSAVIDLENDLIFIDPVGSQSQYSRFGRPDIVVLTRAHPDHLSIDTMIGMLRRDTVVLAPQDVIDQLPLMISNNTIAPFAPGTAQVVNGIRFTAMPPDADLPGTTQVYQRDRGDIGVTMEIDGTIVFF